MKVDILAIGVHPDDVEMGCGGTLLKLIDLDYTVAIVDLTRGELGTRGNISIRKNESMEAAKYLGILSRIQLGMKDGFMEIDQVSINKVIQAIRFFQPEIILSNAVHDRHPDHGLAAKLVSRAAFLSGLIHINSTSIGAQTQQIPWRPKSVYNYIQDRQLKADFVIDITNYIDQKIELIKLYKSQFFDVSSDEPQTPLTSSTFFDYLIAKAKIYGRPAGFEAAEGFTVERTLGLNNFPELET